ncbi:MAG: carbonic anhydrase family protein [Pseudomonadota bacterium]
MRLGLLLLTTLTLPGTALAQGLSFDALLAQDAAERPRAAEVATSPEGVTTLTHQTAWQYDGDGAPSAWHTLDPAFAACAGANQSPVDIRGTVDAELPPLAFHYTQQSQAVTNDGRTVQFSYPEPHHMRLDGKRYALQHIALHAPSENRIDGEAFALELQLTHRTRDGDTAIVSVLGALGGDNPDFDDIMYAFPALPGHAVRRAKPIDPARLLPDDHAYYRFNGSLTTPPCTEGVVWLVLKSPVRVSAAQVHALSTAIGQDNNRPVQPLNARLVLE